LAVDVGGDVGAKGWAQALSVPFASFGKNSSQPQQVGDGAVVAEKNERGRKRGTGLATDVGGYEGTKGSARSLSAKTARSRKKWVMER
jgi:hypothetical protein